MEKHQKICHLRHSNTNDQIQTIENQLNSFDDSFQNEIEIFDIFKLMT